MFIFSPFLEDVTLPRGVNIIFTMERAIKRGFFPTNFLTVLLAFLELGTLFVSLDVTVLISGRKLSHGNVVCVIGLFAVF